MFFQFNFLFLLAKNHHFVFHNASNANDYRGYEIYIIYVYSEGILEDLKRIEPKNYKSDVIKLRDNNAYGLEIFKIDINPWLAVQTIDINSADNVINCVLLLISQNYKSKDSTKLILGSQNFKDNIHVDCTQNGIKIRR